jgi:hypothetical protein
MTSTCFNLVLVSFAEGSELYGEEKLVFVVQNVLAELTSLVSTVE